MRPARRADHFPAQRIPIYVDNQAAIAILNSNGRGRTRHFDIRLMFLRIHERLQDYRYIYVPTAFVL